jgi:hypothetical protein
VSIRAHYPDGYLELNDGVVVRFSTRYGDPEDADYCGGILEHPALPGKPADDEGRCSGSFYFRGYAASPQHHEWDILSESPLALSPSFLCHCGFHGFIRDGRWVPA